MKKIAVYSVLSGVLAAGMLTACSSNQTSTQNSSTQNSSAQTQNSSAQNSTPTTQTPTAAKNASSASPAAAQKSSSTAATASSAVAPTASASVTSSNPNVTVTKGLPVIAVEIKDNKIVDDKGILKAGSAVHFLLVNRDKEAYTLTNKELNLNKVMEPGQTENFAWTSPKKPGKYVIDINKNGQKDKVDFTLTLK
ncbi:cupredoxin domain-containing protein [Aneurinibacillus terranovensis]|uniref:cupredoxin domain-containing protein n=1 Tax=Aneurinibacillus terranovensis TaxID=278991 RepID=UPI000480BE3F|nr:cupredoxin domain-containing protein [Aneurinibacillus terranovensis]